MGFRLLFSVLYNVVAWMGIILGLVLGSWWPVVILCPIALFILPRVLAWLSPLIVVSPEQTLRARRVNLVLLVLFVLLVLGFGLT